MACSLLISTSPGYEKRNGVCHMLLLDSVHLVGVAEQGNRPAHSLSTMLPLIPGSSSQVMFSSNDVGLKGAPLFLTWTQIVVAVVLQRPTGSNQCAETHACFLLRFLRAA